jgi:4-diphosphocytidyl-2-C-methyl-D-erythritol kinase
VVLFPAPAKINLTLEVLARRDDGYHGIRSLMVPLQLADELAIEPSDRFVFSCDRAELAGSANLVVRALDALGIRPSARLELRKRIPAQAGLGGGSSDAAAVLRAAMSGTFGEPPNADWIAVARRLGSDVPFFLAQTAALVEGTGERVTPVGGLPAWSVLVVKPPVAVSTAAAYEAIAAAPRTVRPRGDSVSIQALSALQRGSFHDVVRLLQNDFHDAIALRSPEIRGALDALRAAGASNAMLAGSGSCVFTLGPSQPAVEDVSARLDLPENYERFVTAFAQTPQWRS